MTTSGGSVWDRGPSDGGEEPPVGGRVEEASGEPLELPAEEAAAAVPPPAEMVDDSVWSRGPVVDVPAPGPLTRRDVAAPVLPPPAPTTPSRRRVIHRHRRSGLMVVGALAVAAGVLAYSFGFVGADDSEAPADESAAVTPVPSTPAPSTMPSSTSAPTAPPTTEQVTTTIAPSTSTTTVPPTTTTTVPPTTTTTVPPTTTTTIPPTTTAPATTVAVVSDGPRVEVVGRVGSCSFGPSCLIADFTIAGFGDPQREFVCEFGNGSRYTFRFDGHRDGDGVEQACATSSADGSITIEVGGVRSQTVTR